MRSIIQLSENVGDGPWAQQILLELGYMAIIVPGTMHSRTRQSLSGADILVVKTDNKQVDEILRKIM